MLKKQENIKISLIFVQTIIGLDWIGLYLIYFYSYIYLFKKFAIDQQFIHVVQVAIN